MESSSKVAMVVDKKKKKRKRRSKEEEDDGFKTNKALEELSSLRPCSFSSSLNGGLKRRICFWGETDEYKPEIDWFVVDLNLDLLSSHTSSAMGPRKADRRKMSAFYHDHCHHTNTDKERKKREIVLSPLFTCKKDCSSGHNIPFYGNSCASLGSILYSIGGCFFDRDMSSGDDHKGASKLVHYFDTNKPTEGWKEAPPMITHRYKPQIVSLHHKLYVFGLDEDYLYSELGPDHDPKSCVWAEVFDPSLGRWTPLPKPPSLLLESDFFIAIVPSNDLDHMKKTNNKGDEDDKDKEKEKKKKILVLGFDFQSSNRAYEFDVATNCWTYSDSSFKLYHRLGTKMNYPHVLVDDALYWVGDEIYAHDIGTGINYAGPVQDLYFHYCLKEDETRIYGLRQPAVFHLGGRYFCALSFDDDNDNRPTFFTEHCQKRIHCLIIKVSTAKDLYFKEDNIYMFLNASVLSCQSFLIDRQSFSIDGLMLL